MYLKIVFKWVLQWPIIIIIIIILLYCEQFHSIVNTSLWTVSAVSGGHLWNTYETYGKNLLLLGEFGSTWVGRS